MAYYNTCPHCGSNLDPGERCECESRKEREQEENRIFFGQFLKTESHGGQMAFSFDHPRGGAMRI